jgi:hypothetical protein
MTTILRIASLALAVTGVSFAQDAIFTKSALVGPSGSKTTPVKLIISNTGVTVQSNDKTPSVIIDLPYSSINNLGYTFTEHGKVFMLPVMGPAALFIKGDSHWLVIEGTTGTSNGKTVLRLDKTEYREVVAALTAKSGKRVEMLAPGSTLVDPTIGSHDEDQMVPFPIDPVGAALKSAMGSCNCKVSTSKVGHMECSRALRPPDSIGGAEVVTAILESQGPQTQVRIRTAKGFGKNWSSPIFREMLRTLQAAH